MMGRQSRQTAMIFVDIESLIPETHLLRKIERMVCQQVQILTGPSIADTVSLVLTGTRVSFSEFKAIAATESSELTSIFIHRKA